MWKILSVEIIEITLKKFRKKIEQYVNNKANEAEKL